MGRTLCWVLAAWLALALGGTSWSADPGATKDARHAQDAQDAEFAQRVAAAQITLDMLDEPLRGKVARLLRQPAIYSRSQARAFPARPFVYQWLLDNPHLAARAWQGLGAKCATIEKKSEGVFTGADPAGGSVRWQRLCEQPGWRAWYAEGTGRPTPFTPAVSMRALVMLNYQEVRGGDGRVGIRHQIEVLSQFEGKTTGLLAKLSSVAFDQSARKTLEQVDLFFSGMAWYLSTNAGSARKLLSFPASESPDDAREVEMLVRRLAEAHP